MSSTSNYKASTFTTGPGSLQCPDHRTDTQQWLECARATLATSSAAYTRQLAEMALKRYNELPSEHPDKIAWHRQYGSLLRAAAEKSRFTVSCVDSREAKATVAEAEAEAEAEEAKSKTSYTKLCEVVDRAQDMSELTKYCSICTWKHSQGTFLATRAISRFIETCLYDMHDRRCLLS
jgi:hypothetical protein